MAPFERSRVSSYWRFTVTVAYLVSFPRSSEILVENCAIFPYLTCIQPLYGSPSNIAIMFGTENYRMDRLPDGENSSRICLLVSMQYTNVTDRQTDRQTDRYHTTA